MLPPSTQSPNLPLASFVDLLRIPEEERWHEILDGELLQKALPRGEHSVSQIGIVLALGRFHRRPQKTDRPGGWWLLSEPTIRLSPHEILRPDVAGYRRERMPEKPTGYPLELRPDWVCEIMCDSDARRRDGLQKRRIYADNGVPHYWLLDTERELLTVLRLGEEGYREVQSGGRTDRVRAEPFDAIELVVGVLFGDEMADE